MPGENLQKLSKEELGQLRTIVRQLYFKDEGFTDQQMKDHISDYECDKLIDSLLPNTVEKCREQGMARNFISRKKFFMPSKILAANGKPNSRM